jgi:hypothetical protein
MICIRSLRQCQRHLRTGFPLRVAHTGSVARPGPAAQTALVHSLVADVLNPGDTAIDATCGNGHDALFLASRVFPGGSLICYDIQHISIDATVLKLAGLALHNASSIHYKCENHGRICDNHPDLIGKVKAVVFNLGYLPGSSDRSILTNTTDTIIAIGGSLPLLCKGGVISIMCYPGHVGGDAESRAVGRLCESLDPEMFVVQLHQLLNRGVASPKLYTIYRSEMCKKPQITRWQGIFNLDLILMK